ncbi:MAG: hypothetical protein E7333_05905 [Clostridiales bacterium]|nr:hypothetical protein [Clostridiales bacterium]
MSKLTDKVSYLTGLADGMKLNMEKDANRLIVEMLGILKELAEEVEMLEDAQAELSDYVESIDDDLCDLEETLFDEEEDECSCGHDDCDCDEDEDYDEDEDEDDDDEVIVYTCPECGYEIEFALSEFDDNMLCPGCKKPVFPEYDEEDEEDEEEEEEIDLDGIDDNG